MTAWTPYKKRSYEPGSKEPFKLSRSKIDSFLECPRCFYLDRRLGVGRPSMAAFTLNNAVDFLLKKEFDVHRAAGTQHPLLKKYGVDAIPFAHKDIDTWRENFVGVQYLHKPTNLLIFGAVDDLWINPAGELMVVDYKATSKDGLVDKLEDTRWHNQYRRQMEIYQWLLKQNGFKVSNTGYFVYVNGQRDRKAFDGKLEFDVRLIPYTGSSDWIDEVIEKIKVCLDGDAIPKEGTDCEYCKYRTDAGETFKKHVAAHGVSGKSAKKKSE